MNTRTTHNTLSPERWLLAVDAPAQAQALQQALAAEASTPTFAGWRLQHGLVQFVAADALAAALRQALDDGCPAVHLHSTLADEVLDTALRAAELAAHEGRLVELQTWATDPEALLPHLQAELARPDAWVEVAWRLNSGVSFPVLAVPGHPGSEAGYRAAFRAWRAERLRLGDSGLSPFEDEDDLEEASPPEPAIKSQFDDEVEGEPLPGLPVLAYGQVPVAVFRAQAGSLGVMRASASSDASQWLDVATWCGHTLAPEGGRWAYTARLQRLVMKDVDAWLGVRVAIEWDKDIAALAQRRSCRICLLPRLQQPVLVTLEAHRTEVPVTRIPQSRLNTWPQAMEGTPLTVLVLP